jgi:hypothetical protein
VTSSEDRLVSALTSLFATLDEERRALLRHPFTDEALRRRWAYTPQRRPGLSFGELDRAGRKAVHRLIAATLSPHAYAQAATIMALEDVLDHAEGGGRDRHQSDYWIIAFGDPAGGQPWAWRFEGHHLSVNITACAGRIVTTPCFFGANPAAVRRGESVVLQPLAAEERLARLLLAEMGPAGRRQAVVADTPPADMHTREAAAVDGTVRPAGVPAGRLAAPAARLLRELLALYLDRLHPDLSGPDRDAAAAADLHFAWEGGLEPGTGHYYRIQAPDLLIEYVNTANDANHVHTVVRRPLSDFGADPLADHHRRQHDAGSTA